MRKVLSLVLVLALVLGSFSFAFAATPTAKTVSDVAGTQYEDAVRVLMSLDVVTGYPDGTYKPAGAVTRAEMAALIVRALGLDSTATFVAKSNFSDMAGNWADKYVALISGKNIVKGYPDGTFKPNAQVSFPEAITMVVRALGYVDGCSSLTGTWPANYMTLATDLNITDNVKVIASGKADRGAVAIMLYNALDVPNVTVDKSSMDASKVILSGSGDSAEYLTMLSKLNVTEDDMTVAPSDVDDQDTLCDLSPYVYSHVTVYLNDDDQIIGVKKVAKDDGATTKYETVKGEFDSSANTVTDANDKEYTLTVTSNTKVYLNGEETTLGAITGANELLDGKDVTVYGAYTKGTDSDEITTVYGIIADVPTGEAQTTKDDVAEIADIIEAGHGSIFGVDLPTVDDNGDELDYADITVAGDATSLSGIKANDIVTVYASADGLNDPMDKVKFVVKRATAEIKVKNTNEADGKVTASNGTIYEVAADQLNDGAVANMDDNAVTTANDFEVGTTYTAYLDQFGYIYALSDVDAEAGNYAIVVDSKDKTSFDDAQLKLFTKDGSTTTFDVTKDVATLSTIVSPGAVIKYETNSTGKVDSVKVLNTDTADYYTAATATADYKASSNTFNSQDIANNAVFFDLTGDNTSGTWAPATMGTESIGDDGDWNVISKLVNDTQYTATYIKDKKNNEIVAMLITASDDSNNNLFAINSTSKAKDNSDDNVFELTGFINGVSADKLTDNTSVTYTAPGLYVVKFDGDAIRSSQSVDFDTITNNTSAAAIFGAGYTIALDKTVTTSGTNDYFKTADGVFNLADDAVVYVKVFDDDNALDSYKVGNLSDIDKGDHVTYVLNDDGNVQFAVVTNQNDL